MSEYAFVGGPWDGRRLDVPEGVSVVEVEEEPGMAYHRTHRLVSGSGDPDWWAKGLAESVHETIYEWHEVEWVAPAVQGIRDAVRDAK